MLLSVWVAWCLPPLPWIRDTMTQWCAHECESTHARARVKVRAHIHTRALDSTKTHKHTTHVKPRALTFLCYKWSIERAPVKSICFLVYGFACNQVQFEMRWPNNSLQNLLPYWVSFLPKSVMKCKLRLEEDVGKGDGGGAREEGGGGHK